MNAQANSLNLIGRDPTPADVAEAYAYCERMAREHYENFPVGSLLVPKPLRKHVYSIYAFARTADDFADEGYEDDLTEAARLAALDDWERKLEDCYRGRAEHPVFIALAETLRELDLPIQLFRDLLSAFKQDVVKQRYADFDEVLNYCARSANPVGRLILLLFGYRDEGLHKLSDHICTALQLTNFWQDVAVDIGKDRVYLPLDEMERFGVSIGDLQARRFSDRYAALLKFQVERTRDFFKKGKNLPALVSGRLAVELKLTWLGGMRILERIEKQRYDTLGARPKITAADKFRLVARSLITRRKTWLGGEHEQISDGDRRIWHD
jgi:squalene synthase HpnC